MVYERQERLNAKITLLVEGEKQGLGFVNFTTEDGAHRFADFCTEACVDNKWLGEKTEVYKALQQAFNDGKLITLILVRFNSERDWVKKTEAVTL